MLTNDAKNRRILCSPSDIDLFSVSTPNAFCLLISGVRIIFAPKSNLADDFRKLAHRSLLSGCLFTEKPMAKCTTVLYININFSSVQEVSESAKRASIAFRLNLL